MQIIADVEDTPRGIYSGAVGWLLDDQSADLGVVIRTLVHRGATYSLGTGGGITVHSRCAGASLPRPAEKRFVSCVCWASRPDGRCCPAATPS